MKKPNITPGPRYPLSKRIELYGSRPCWVVSCNRGRSIARSRSFNEPRYMKGGKNSIKRRVRQSIRDTRAALLKAGYTF